MNKRKVMTIAVGAVLVLSFAFVYGFYFSKTSSFPSKERLVEEINHTFPEANVRQVQDVMDIGDRQKFVPFVTKDGRYGQSLWQWDKFKWKAAYVKMTGEPHLWKVKKGDPSTYYFVWNIHPDDRLDKMTFYLIRDRGYRVTEGTKEAYFPRIQMSRDVSLAEGEKSYGVMQIPKEWAAVIASLNDTQSTKETDWFIDQVVSNPQVFYGWIPYGKDGEEIFPEQSVNGNIFSDGGVSTEHLMILNESEIEVP